MKLRVKDMDIATGGVLIAVLNEDDARTLDLHYEDRIKIKKGSREIVAVVDIAETKKAVPRGEIGLFEEVLDKLHAKNNDEVSINLGKKPESLSYIGKKIDGKELSANEIDTIIKDLMNNNITDIELTYFISACYTHGLSLKETIALTKAMIKTGNVLKLKRYPILDLHSIGGVPGNRTTMIIVPIIAAAGLTIPKTSSRSITSPAGAADTMEVLANVSLPLEKIKKVVNKVGGCIVWGGAVNLAPADDKIIKVENPLSIDAEGNMLSSIMAKKGSVSSTHLLIDMPVGKGAKIESMKLAKKIKREFENIGKGMHIKVKVVITDGSQPIGNGIGPALEARDVLWILKGDPRGPRDLKEKSIKLAEELLAMAGKNRRMAREILDSGRAHKKMIEIIRAQGKKITDPSKIKLGSARYNVVARRSGIISQIDNKAISKIARLAGAPQDKEAGIYLYKHKSDRIKKGERIMTIYAQNRRKLNFAVSILKEIDGIKIR